MRKLKLQVQMTIDGFIAGPAGEMDWIRLPWTEDINNYVDKITDPVDTIVLGRKLAEGFIPYWASVAADPGNPEFTSGKKFIDTPKVVFSRTLDTSNPEVKGWNNTILAKGSLSEEINRLKKLSPAGSAETDIIAYGGATFVSDLISHGLIDEYHLFINPTAIGKGMSIFTTIDRKHDLDLVNAVSFNCGIVVLHYEPKSA
jgi:dihydrofolate reductase